MRAVIIGCGRVGAAVAKQLADDGWDVTCVDEDENALAKFIYLKWLLGEDFEDLPDRAWLMGLLEDRARPAAERMAVAIEGVEHQLENEPSDTVA